MSLAGDEHRRGHRECRAPYYLTLDTHLKKSLHNSVSFPEMNGKNMEGAKRPLRLHRALHIFDESSSVATIQRSVRWQNTSNFNAIIDGLRHLT
jgi:hypothetical protein